MIARKLVALLCLFSLTVNAQDVPRLGETIDVSIVNIEVFVTDKQGNRVRGLKKGDFEIYENGVRQPISNFAEYRGSDHNVAVGLQPGEAPAPVEAAPREKRTVVVFFETSRMPRHVIDPLVTGIRTALRELVGPQDTVSFIAWNKEGSRYYEFTNDLDQIDTALELVAEAAEGVEVDEAMQHLKESQAIALFEKRIEERVRTAGQAPTLRGGGGGGGGATHPEIDALATTAAVTAGLQLSMSLAYSHMQKRVAAINSAITTMAGDEGKKILLLVPRRLSEIAGAEIVYLTGRQDVPLELRQRFSTTALLQTVMDNANANGVTIYPIYPPGLATTMTHADFDVAPPPVADYLTLQNEVTSLNEVARQTGGLSGAGIGDVVELLPRIAEDATDYYSLGYRDTAANADRARTLVVKVRNGDLVVRSRRQHVGKSDETRMRDRLITALFRQEQSSEMPIEAGIKGEHGSRRSVSVRVPIGALTALPQPNGKLSGAFSVYVGAAADFGKLSDVTKKTQPFEIDAEQMETARTGYFTYDLDLDVNDDARYVAVAVLDEVGRTWGATRIDLRAPASE